MDPAGDGARRPGHHRSALNTYRQSHTSVADGDVELVWAEVARVGGVGEGAVGVHHDITVSGVGGGQGRAVGVVGV